MMSRRLVMTDDHNYYNDKILLIINSILGDNNVDN